MSTATRTIAWPSAEPGPDQERPPDMFTLRTECCPIELAVHLGSLTVLWARFRAESGRLRLTDDGAALDIEVAPEPVRGNVPLLGRLLRPLRGGQVRFECRSGQRIARRGLRLPGTLHAGSVRRSLVLRAQIVHRDDDSVVLFARGVLTPVHEPELGPPARLLVRLPLRVQIAAEFVR